MRKHRGVMTVGVCTRWYQHVLRTGYFFDCGLDSSQLGRIQLVVFEIDDQDLRLDFIQTPDGS